MIRFATMDNPKKRKLVAAEHPYEVDSFAEKHGITRAAARAIIKANGPSRRKCDAAAKAAK